MKIDTTTIDRLRDVLMERGQRPTMVMSPAYEELTKSGLLSKEESEALDRVGPIAEAMFLMMAADDNIAEEELDVIKGAIRDLSDSKIRSGTVKVMLESYANEVEREGWQERLTSLATELSQAPDDAETAYTLVAAVALADDEVTLAENELIDRFAELLGLNDQRCCELLDLVKNDRSHPPWGKED